MDMRTVFPSKYLRAPDLKGHDVAVTITRVTMEDVEHGKPKPVIHFQGKERGLVLNQVNNNTLIGLLGPDSDRWIGQAVTLFPTMTDFKGSMVDCIRLKAAPTPAPVMNPAQVQPPAAPVEHPTEDEIPF